MKCSRRQFATGLTLLGSGLLLPRATAYANAFASGFAEPEELRGNKFHLDIDQRPVNFTGTDSIGVAVNGSIPAPTLRWKEGETVTISVTNHLHETSSIHWHGILLPANMDGVPGLSFAGIPPGKTFTYKFKLKQSGTYWYHSHSGFQEQKGVYGAIIVDPAEPDPVSYDRDTVVILSDWTDDNPMRIFANLKKQSDYYNFNKQTMADLIDSISSEGLGPTWINRKLWGQMRMLPTDFADVSAYAYSYLLNGQPPTHRALTKFRAGEKLRLRIVNAAAMTFFDLRIPGLPLTVVAADGQNVHPVTVDEIRIGVAETYDVIVQPQAEMAYSLFAQTQDRSGFASGILAEREGLNPGIPEVDEPQLLTMNDMGHGAMAAGHHNMHQHDAMQAHPKTEYANPGVDMLTMQPEPRLSDPGIGLRGNGRRVLTYADLHSLFPDPDPREPSRDIELHLTGHMERYIWSFNGIQFADAEPLKLQYGERVRFTLVNDTMMEHPIHLHGVWSDLEHENAEFGVRKHTINMPPGTRRHYRVSADALGRWAYHCHLLFHMEAGMFREVRIDV